MGNEEIIAELKSKVEFYDNTEFKLIEEALDKARAEGVISQQKINNILESVFMK